MPPNEGERVRDRTPFRRPGASSGAFVRLPSFAPGQAIGLLGGSFNPPHDGHRLISELALRRLRLDRLWWRCRKSARNTATAPRRWRYCAPAFSTQSNKRPTMSARSRGAPRSVRASSTT